jgi:hypothetical protein
VIDVSFTSIKVSDKVKADLDSIRLDKESYNIAIQRLIRENQSLRYDKDCLMKIAMKTEDSIAFPNVNHSVHFALSQVLGDGIASDDEKLSALKIYLRPSLDEDCNAVLTIIDEFKSENRIGVQVLDDLTAWIRESYQK